MLHPGSYTDGRSAARLEVSVQADRMALRIHRVDGALLEAWPYAGLYAGEEVHGEGPVRLRHRERGEATLTLPGAALLREMEALGGPRLRARAWLRPSLLAAALALGCVGLAVASAAWWLPTLVAPLARQVPPAWEQALGERTLEHLAGGHSFCTRAVGQAALAALAARLAARAELPYPLHVHVLPGDAVNAFTAPGGHIVVINGLLREAQSAEEVAGVLAHEIAHVAARDPLQTLIRAAGAQVLFGTLTGSGSALDEAATRFAQSLVLFSYSRQAELDADRTALALLNGADIRGEALAGFLARVAGEPAGAGRVPALLSTHPVTAERIALIHAGAQGRGDALSGKQWAALRSICD